jgi:phosphopantetheine adenylyltransferase
MHAGTVPLSSEQEKHALSERIWQPLSTSPLAVENYDELLAFATDTAVQAVLVRVLRQLPPFEVILRTATLQITLYRVLNCFLYIYSQ